MISETLPLDPALPSLQAAWDPERMTPVFRSGLRCLGSRAVEIVGSRIERFRYRRGERAILLYSLSVRHLSGGPVTEQWLTGSLYPGNRARRLFQRMRREYAGREPGEESFFGPIHHIPSLEMVLQAYPFDRYLPALPALVSDPWAAMEQVGAGGWRPEEARVSLLRYRPFQGAALCCDFAGRRPGRRRLQSRRLHAKLYRRDEGARTCRLIERIRSSNSEHRAFSTPAAVGYLRDLRLLIVKAAPGPSLKQSLEENPAPSHIAELATNAAEGLSALHRSRLSTSRRWRRSDSLERARVAGIFIKTACPKLAQSVDNVVEALTERIEDCALRPAHLDLKPDHLFVTGSRTHFIDLDTFAMADPVLDMANLFARLESLSEKPDSGVDPSGCKAAAEVFRSEYFARVPTGWGKRFFVDYSLALLDLACSPLRHREPNWAQKTMRTLEKAATAVGRAVKPRSRIAVSFGGAL
ncbi:MAG: phosphotransferase [Acidobacteriota bacterium]|nr:phosphotransferase [Acidobacteriota bacterium]